MHIIVFLILHAIQHSWFVVIREDYSVAVVVECTGEITGKQCDSLTLLQANCVLCKSQAQIVDFCCFRVLITNLIALTTLLLNYLGDFTLILAFLDTYSIDAMNFMDSQFYSQTRHGEIAIFDHQEMLRVNKDDEL